MKNKLLVSVFAVALVALAFTSCKEKTDFNGICDDISEKTLQGYFSGAEMFGDNMVLNVIQYQFKDDGTVERTVMAEGDGVYNAPVTRKFSSYDLGEYFDLKRGRYITLNPEDGGEPLKVKFYIGGIIEDAQPFAGDKNNKIGDLAATDTTVLGKKWYGNDTTFYKIDTIVDVLKYDTTYNYTPKKDPETGTVMRDSTGHIIYEQTIKDITETIVPTKMKWPIAPKTINIRRIELNRDPATLENTGKWYMLSQAYDIDDNRQTTLKVDTTAAFDFHWAYTVYTSTASFVIRAVVDGTGEQEFFTIQYDFRLPAVTIDKQVLKVEE